MDNSTNLTAKLERVQVQGFLKVEIAAVETSPTNYETPPSWGSVRRRADFVMGRSEFIRQAFSIAES